MSWRRRNLRSDRRNSSTASSAVIFAGRFAALFPGAYQVVQTDLGLTYGGTLLANTGSTATTVVTLTGTLATTPVPIWVISNDGLAVGSGANFSVYFDGVGITEAQNVTPSVGVPVALAGAGAGLSLTWSAGSGVVGNGWKATCVGLADQSGNAKHYSQATASKQPIITVGLNGKPGLLSDGVDDTLVSALNMPATTATPWTLLFVGKNIAGNTSKRPMGATSGNNPGFAHTGTGLTQTGLGNAGVWDIASGKFAAITAYYSSTTADSLRVGSNSIVTGTAATGGVATSGREIFSSLGASFSVFEFLAAIYVPGNVSDAAFRAAVNSALGYGVGNVLV